MSFIIVNPLCLAIVWENSYLPFDSNLTLICHIVDDIYVTFFAALIPLSLYIWSQTQDTYVIVLRNLLSPYFLGYKNVCQIFSSQNFLSLLFFFPILCSFANNLYNIFSSLFLFSQSQLFFYIYFSPFLLFSASLKIRFFDLLARNILRILTEFINNVKEQNIFSSD